MEEEAEKLKEMQKQVEDSLMSPTANAQGTGKLKKMILIEVDPRNLCDLGACIY